MDVVLPQAGELFEARYRIEAEIGQGGFSRVFRAVDQADGRVVAVKILVPAKIDNGDGPPVYQGDLAERFMREARVLENVREGHAIQLLNHGQTAGGVLFMVFEYVDGRNLFDVLKESGAFPPEQVVDVLIQTLQTLQAAHSQGILHRDIKPNNLMLTSAGQIKVLDFGIAKAFGDASPGNDLTAAGMLVGTPRYMAPEQLRGLQIGPAADIYSLGILGVEMLTGRKAMRGKDRLEIMQQQLMPQSVQLPEELDVPPRLRDTVNRMVQKDLRVRYASAAAVLRDLQFWNHAGEVQDDTMAGTVPSDFLRAPSGEATVLTTVRTGDLAQQVQDQTVSSGFSGAWGNQPASYPPQPDRIALGTQFGKQMANPSMSQMMQQYGSGQFPQQTPPPGQGGWGSGQYPAMTPPASYPSSGAIAEPTPDRFDPTPQQKVLLGISLLIPGLAHVMIGQTKKGVIFFVLLFLTVGLFYAVSIVVAFDAYLVLRAQRTRHVGDFEFFPDSKSFFG